MAHYAADAIRRLRRAASMRSLYPPGHPIHASSVEHARQGVKALLGEGERADLVIGGGGIALGDETLPDEDGVVGELATRWGELGLCGLSIARGVSDEELDLLMVISAPSSAGMGSDEIRHRLEELGGHVGIVELDYERFVPRSQARRELPDELAGPDIQRALRELAEASRGETRALDEERRNALNALLEYPEALASAIEIGVLGGLGASYVATEGEVATPARPTWSSAAGERLALTVQRLAQVGLEMAPEDPEAVYGKLAEALRSLGREEVAAAFRATRAASGAGSDALAEISRHMSVPELVVIARSGPQALAAEPSAVYRRLLERLSGGGERLDELAPALQQALLEDGVAEDVYASTVGMAVAELRALSAERVGAATPASPTALNRTPLSERAARRAEIEGMLGEVFGEGAWTKRAFLSLELLRGARAPAAIEAAAAGIWNAIGRIPPGEREEVWQRIVLELAEVVDRRGTGDGERRAAACSVIAETSAPHRVAALLRAYESEGAETRQRIVLVLARMGEEGLVGAMSLLTGGEDLPADEDVACVVHALIETEQEGRGGGTHVARLLTDPSCKVKAKILQALTGTGGPSCREWLLDAVRYGDGQLRWDIVKAAGQEPARHIEVLEAALDDSDESVACAAADHLGASSGPRVGAALSARVRPFDPRDPRPQLRVAAVRALGRLRYAEATEALGLVLSRKTFWHRGPNDALRLAAAEALVAIGTEEALQAVASHAGRERCAKIRALARRVTEAIVPVVGEGGTTDAA